jgi:IS30 family transposase
MARNDWLAEPEAVLRGHPRKAGGYRAEAAQQQRATTLSVKACMVRKQVVGIALFGLVVAHLSRGLSPEQIVFTLGTIVDPVRHSQETIYTALYARPRGQ